MYAIEDFGDVIPLYYRSNQLHIPKAMSSFGPDGGIVSNAKDSMLFLRAFFEGKIFPQKYLEVAMSEYNRIFFPLQSGVGIMYYDLPRIFTIFKKLPSLVGHSGLSGAFAYYCPDRELFFTGTVNQIANPGRSYRLLIQLLGLV